MRKQGVPPSQRSQHVRALLTMNPALLSGLDGPGSVRAWLRLKLAAPVLGPGQRPEAALGRHDNVQLEGVDNYGWIPATFAGVFRRVGIRVAELVPVVAVIAAALGPG